MTALSAADYRGALDFLGTACESNEVDAPFPEYLLSALRVLIPSSIAAYHEWSADGGYQWHASGADRASLEKVWAGYPNVMLQDPIPGGWGRGERAGMALKFSDFLTLREFRRLDLHAEMCRPFGTDYVMKLFLRTRSGGASFVLDKAGHDFSERDRAVLDVLAPHLDSIRRRHQRPHRVAWNAATDTLSPREDEVLRLVACGMTNREIASVLFIAVGTVRKHLDNVYAKLGVRSRAQAVAETADRG
jgi:DNA-binding CsgD family transcriptional regulator